MLTELEILEMACFILANTDPIDDKECVARKYATEYVTLHIVNTNRSEFENIEEEEERVKFITDKMTGLIFNHVIETLSSKGLLEYDISDDTLSLTEEGQKVAEKYKNSSSQDD